MTCIDVFSKYAWVVPVKSKSASEITWAFRNLLEKLAYPRVPKRIQSDKGKEFLNKNVREYLQQNGVEHFTTWSDQKAAVVERFNRTLKNRIWQYFTASRTKYYFEILPALVNSYNHSLHRSIGMAPEEASEKKNEQIVWSRLYINKQAGGNLSLPSSPLRGGIFSFQRGGHWMQRGINGRHVEALQDIDTITVHMSQ